MASLCLVCARMHVRVCVCVPASVCVRVRVCNFSRDGHGVIPGRVRTRARSKKPCKFSTKTSPREGAPTASAIAPSSKSSRSRFEQPSTDGLRYGTRVVLYGRLPEVERET